MSNAAQPIWNRASSGGRTTGRAGRAMNVRGKVAVVTGGAGGIGAALAHRLTDAGARVVVADRDPSGAAAVAERVGGVAAHGDVSRTDVLGEIFALAESRLGPVDLFFANAGVGGEAGIGDSDDGWQHAIDVNVLAHVRAARLLVPGWLARGSGYFVATASAAGLLTQIGGAPYSVTKHAAVAFSEWLSVTYGDRGIRVSCVCPMGVNTNMLNGGLDAAGRGLATGRRRGRARRRRARARRCRPVRAGRRRTGALSRPAASGGARLLSP